MLWIGLTGGIASGKSTVSQILKKMHYDVVDADVLAREVIEPGSEGYQKILQHFGPGILLNNQNIDRIRLGEIVFKNSQELLFLESVIHPAIQQRLLKIKSELVAQKKKIAFYDVPLLFEKKLQYQFDAVVLVWCDSLIQLQRLMQRNQLSKADAELRIRAQIPLDDKKSLSDFVILNSGSLQDLEQQVKLILSQILQLTPRP